MSTTSANVVALISGGKDSLFSLLHCIQNGHKIIALANLYPISTATSETLDCAAAVEGEDLNSFMYQTVGHTIIPLYAEALGLPLYRCQTRGTAVNTGQYYALTEHGALDETEDLVTLLQGVKKAHPDVNALSTGAILSTYQRTRIESVAVRLGLTSIAFLWQYPALPPPTERADSLTGLLDDMEAASCDARFVKIASAGISEAFLWSRVSSPAVKKRLVSGMSQFAEGDDSSLMGAVLGEGGEYETLAVNGPPRVWKKRIQIDSRSNVVIRDEGGATRLAFGKAETVDQSPARPDDETPLVRVPSLFDVKFSLLRNSLLQADNAAEKSSKSHNFQAWACSELHQNAFQDLASCTVSNVTDTRLSSNATEQVTAIFDQLHSVLEVTFDPMKASPTIISTTVLLRHLSDYIAVNDVCREQFNCVNPPARVTVCCGDSLPENVLVSVSFILSRVASARLSGLHVQSISYWAPANIGPYSQAIDVPALTHVECEEKIVHVAGQIPLVPSSMQLLEEGFLSQAILSLQHIWRVGQCVRADWWVHGVAYLADAGLEEMEKRAKVGWQAWKAANAPVRCGRTDADDEDSDDGNVDLDVWDLKHNHQSQPNPRTPGRSANARLRTLPNRKVLTRSQSPSEAINTDMTTATPPFLAAHVFSLPRLAPIEWHSLGLARLPQYPVSKPCLSLSAETYDHISISISRLKVVRKPSAADSDGSGDEVDDKSARHPQPPAPAQVVDFFFLQISTDRGSSRSSGDLTESLEAALARLGMRKGDNDGIKDEGGGGGPKPRKGGRLQGRRWRFTHLTIYACSQAGHDALTATGLVGMGALIPCRSLWGAEGKRVEIAIIGRREGEEGWERECPRNR